MNFVIVYETSSGPQTVELDQPTLMIGTLPSNQIVIAGQGIDPIHGLYEVLDDGSWRITDLGSDGGISVNGKKIDVEKTLSPGDLVKIGSVEMTFKVEDKIPAPPIGVPVPPPVDRTQSPAPTPVVENPASGSSESAERGEKLFSPREAKPAGDVLEIVAYWGDTVLEVEHYEPGKGNSSKARIGRPPEDDFIAAGPKDLKGFALAKASSSGYKVKLIDGMRGRLRKSGKVEKVTEGNYSLSRRDIAHIKYGPISYFMLYVRPPKLNIPKSSPRDPLFQMLMMVGLLLVTLIGGLLVTGEPSDQRKEKADDVWEVVAAPVEKKPVKKVKPKKKPKPKVAVKKTPPKKENTSKG